MALQGWRKDGLRPLLTIAGPGCGMCAGIDYLYFKVQAAVVASFFQYSCQSRCVWALARVVAIDLFHLEFTPGLCYVYAGCQDQVNGVVLWVNVKR